MGSDFGFEFLVFPLILLFWTWFWTWFLDLVLQLVLNLVLILGFRLSLDLVDLYL